MGFRVYGLGRTLIAPPLAVHPALGAAAFRRRCAAVLGNGLWGLVGGLVGGGLGGGAGGGGGGGVGGFLEGLWEGCEGVVGALCGVGL